MTFTATSKASIHWINGSIVCNKMLRGAALPYKAAKEIKRLEFPPDKTEIIPNQAHSVDNLRKTVDNKGVFSTG